MSIQDPVSREVLDSGAYVRPEDITGPVPTTESVSEAIKTSSPIPMVDPLTREAKNVVKKGPSFPTIILIGGAILLGIFFLSK